MIQSRLGAALLGSAMLLGGLSPVAAQAIKGNVSNAGKGNYQGHIARPLRYRPEGNAFVIVNGVERFNRPLYGGNTAFRVDGGDKPEISLYLPGRGGNLRFAVRSSGTTWWLHDAQEIETRYLPGELDYRIRDPRLGKGEIHLRVLADFASEAVLVRSEGKAIARGTSLVWAFGGVNGQRGARDGDIGTERVPISQYFQPQPEFADGNRIEVAENSFDLYSNAGNLHGAVLGGSVSGLASADHWDDLSRLFVAPEAPVNRPLVIGTLELARKPSVMVVQATTRRPNTQSLATYRATMKDREAEPVPPPLLPAYAPETLGARFEAAEKEAKRRSEQLLVSTPDAFLNASVAALNAAGEAIWDDTEKGVMHGAIAWRVKLLGWRGHYAPDALGQHERAATNFRGWFGRQNVSPIPAEIPGPDENSNLARSENAINSNGDMSNSHYDMNTVFLDALTRHLAWTGDLALAEEAWPVLERHLAWERRLFRRTFDDSGLPLYDSYAQIWASDDIYYNGGGTAIGSAYNAYLNRQVSRIAELLGKDPKPYRDEADAIEAAMRKYLWLPDRGAFGEYKDLLGRRRVHRSAGLWSYYHVIDSQVSKGSEGWTLGGTMLRVLPRIPIEGTGVPADRRYAVYATSEWMPYYWSVNNVVMGENLHAALALWQTDRPAAAWQLTKSALLASMFMGISPGNVGTMNYLDVYRREAQRDFADGVGMMSRAIVEGLFGIRPDALNGTIHIVPGLPDDWAHAKIRHSSVSLEYRRQDPSETWSLNANPRFRQVEWRLPARAEQLESVKINGKPARWETITDSIGRPRIRIVMPNTGELELTLSWRGAAITPSEDDGPLVKRQQGQFEWLAPDGSAPAEAPEFQLTNQHQPEGKQESIDLAPFFNDKLTSIFTKGKYLAPRVKATLSLPSQGIGAWAGHVNELPLIDDAGLRAAAGPDGVFRLPDHGQFALPGAREGIRAMFVSNWANYPVERTVPLTGRARYLRLLMAGTTNPMQSRIDNGEVVIAYADGSTARLPLYNPTSWWPIERDFLIDDFQFRAPGERPLRVDLKTGRVRTPAGVEERPEGGSATVLGISLDPSRALQSVTIRALSQDVLIGTLALTLTR